MNRLQFASAVALFFGFCCTAALAQGSGQPASSGSQLPSITVGSNLVLVPALVKKGGKPVFSLSADDFILTDNGIPRQVRMERDTLLQPMALAIVVQTGGQGAGHLHDYRHLGAVLDAVIGGVPHRVAVVAFDSVPRLKQDFTTDTDAAAKTIAGLHRGDEGASILDVLNFGIHLLSKQPPAYRRVVLLCSETIDGSSRTSLEEAVRAVGDTNTLIYSFAFSSTRAAVKHAASRLPGGSGSSQPYAPGGCMSRDPGADPDAHGSRARQALDCAGDLLPPIRLVQIAFVAAKEGLKRNVPKSVAQMTGGEYFAFKNAKTLTRGLITISNEVPNYYVLSFRPHAPDVGFHTLDLRVKDNPWVHVSARKGYWVDPKSDATQPK